MKREEYRAAADNMVYLVSCAVNGTVPDKRRVRDMDLKTLYAAADHHLLTAAVAFALESAGVYDAAFTQAKAKAIRKVALMDAEMAGIFVKMDEAGIWHMPLKGTVMKDYYPRFGMREMADHDILFDASRAEDVKAIMAERDYDIKHYGTGNHDCYCKEPVCYFEMHRALFDTGHDQPFQDYYRDIENRLAGEGYEKRFTPEDFYIYMLAHEHKHYFAGGTGLRSVLDTYVYLSRVSLDMDYVEAETRKLGICDFEKENRSLAMHLFGGGELTAAEREMLEYILSSGTYGTAAHSLENKMKKKGWGKLRYVLDRFFVPVSRKNRDYEAFAGKYPFFYKHKILLVFLPFYRTVRSVKNGRFRAEANAIRKAKIQ